MDYKDYLQQKNFQHFWHKAKKNLVFVLLKSVFADFKNDRIILDIGCGTGDEIAPIKKFGHVEAMDNSEEALAIARQNECTVIKINIEQGELNKNYYDCICCFDVLEHIKNDTLIIKKFYNSLKPGGFFIFTVPSCKILFGPHDRALDHFRRYNKKEIKRKLEQSGFEIIKLNFWNSFLFPAITIFRFYKIFIYKILKTKKISPESGPINKILNNFLFKILNFENKLATKNISFPFGLSIYGIAEKANREVINN